MKSFSKFLPVFHSLLAVVLAAWATGSGTAVADIYSWTGSGTSANWSITGTSTKNWVTGTGAATPVASSTNSLFFNSPSIKLSNTNNFGSGSTFGSLTYGALAGANTGTGNSINFGGITNSSSNLQTLNLTVGLGSGNTIDTGAAGITINTLSGTSITKNGSGTLTINLTSSNLGSITVASGTLVSSNALSNAAVTVSSGATYNYSGNVKDIINNGGTVNRNAPANLSGNLTLNSGTFTSGGNVSGTVSINGGSFVGGSNQTFTGGYNQTGGLATLGANASLGAATVSSGTLDGTAGKVTATSFNQSGGAVQVADTSTLGAFVLSSGSFVGNGSVTTSSFQQTGGDVNVANSMTNSGVGSLSNGTLEVGNNSSLGDFTLTSGTLTAAGSLVTSSFTQVDGLATMGANSTLGPVTTTAGVLSAGDGFTSASLDQGAASQITVGAGSGLNGLSTLRGVFTSGANGTFGDVVFVSGTQQIGAATTFTTGTASGGSQTFAADFTALSFTVTGGTQSFGLNNSLGALLASGGVTQGIAAADTVINNGGNLEFRNGANVNSVQNNSGQITIDNNGAGVLNVAGNFSQGSGGTLNMTITDATTFDQVALQGGVLTYGGNLVLNLASTTQYANYTDFQLFDGFVSTSGTLAGITLNTTGEYAGLTFGLATSSTNPYMQRYGAGVWITDWTANNQAIVFNQNTGVLTVVPEPSTIVFAGIGMAMFGWSTWTRRRAQARRKMIEDSIA